MNRWGLALFDQAVVSGSRFLISIVVGRTAGPDELGRYAIAFYVLVLLGCVQEALLTTPFAICSPRLRKRSKAALGDGVVVLHVMLIVSVAWVGLAAVGIAAILPTSPETFRMIAALAIAAPLSLMWEFARRMMLAQLRVVHATVIDVVAALLQLAGLTALAQSAQLDGATALAAVGIGCALPAMIYAWRLRPRNWPRYVRMYWGRNWQLGKWVMGSQLARAISSLIPVWFVAALASDREAGMLAACMNIPMISNPFIFAIGNLLMPKAAHAYSDHGVRAVVRLVLGAIAGMAIVLVPLGLVLAVAGDRILEITYGPEYADQGVALAILGLCPMLWAATSAIGCGQAALKDTRASFAATITGIVVTALAIAMLAPQWRALGGVTGLAIGSAAMCALQIWQFWKRCQELAGDPRPASAANSNRAGYGKSPSLMDVAVPDDL